MTNRHPPLAVGAQFGPYRLQRLIGRGGMGEVFEAYDTTKDRTVAIKVLPDRLADDPVYRERFRRESHAAARLQEPHVIPIHDYGEIAGHLYLDMRLVDGRSLRELLRAEGPLAPSRAVALIAQIGAALDAAHADDLVHRDVKPDNILVTRDDFAYLVDFGIAHSGTKRGLTKSGSAVGSFHYMAPERFTAGPITGAVDIYALTCVLYECLTGTRAYPADSEGELVLAHMFEPAPRPSLLGSGVPEVFDAVIARGLAKAPTERYHTAGALAAAARSALTGAGSVDTLTDLPLDAVAARLRGAGPLDETQEAVTRTGPGPAAAADTELSEIRDTGIESSAAGTADAEDQAPAEPTGDAPTGATSGADPVGPEPDDSVSRSDSADSEGRSWRRKALGVLAVVAAVLLAIAADTAVWTMTHRSVSGTASGDGTTPRGADLPLLASLGPVGYKRGNCLHEDPDSNTVAVLFCQASAIADKPAARFYRFRSLDKLHTWYRSFSEVFRPANCPGDPPGADGPSTKDGKTVGRKGCFDNRMEDPAQPRPALVLTNEPELAVAVYLWANPAETPMRDTVAELNIWQFSPPEEARDQDHFSAADLAMLRRLGSPDFTTANCLRDDPPAGPTDAFMICTTRRGFPSAAFFGFPDPRSAPAILQGNRSQNNGYVCAGTPDDVWRVQNQAVGRFFCYVDTSEALGTRVCLLAAHEQRQMLSQFCTQRADARADTGVRTEAALVAWFLEHAR